ncbi:MAG: TolC family protein [Ignavibacteriae bacterium]|nr:TolC family protein [Ignavibacteriota bacterium]
MKRSLLLLMLLPALSLAGRGPGLTLDDAIAAGLSQSRTLRASAARADAAEARAGEARTTRLPMLRGEASYRRLSEVDPFQIQLPGAAKPIEISPVVLNNSSFRVSLQQPLFTGFRISNSIESAERGAEAAGWDNVNDRADLVLAITSAYWSLYQMREVERFAGENVARLDRYLGDARKLMQAGLATRNDVLKIEVQLSNAHLAQIDAENDARLAAMNLNTLLSRPVDMPVDLLSRPADDPLTSHPPTDSLTKAALAGRADLQAWRARVEASRAGLGAARAGWWPQLALSGNYVYARPNSRIFPVKDEFQGTWDVGVALSMDLWNWGMTARQTEAAEAAVRQQEYLSAQMEDAVALEVNRAALQMNRARQRAEVAALALGQAEEQSRTTEQRFTTGLATATDLLDAEVSLQQAKTTQSGARVECEIARARLTRALGVATP